MALPARQGQGQGQAPADGLKAFLAERSAELAATLPKHLTPERTIGLLVNLAYRNPQLQECDRNSILASAVQAAALGLDLSPSLGEAYLIPRWNSKAKCLECQFQPGYQGLAKLARQAGGLHYLQARAVHKGDKFRLRYAPDLTFEHEPSLSSNRGDVTHLYAVAKLSTGEYLCEVMTAEEVEAIRRRSNAAQSGPWVTDWTEMAKKTVLKRLVKSLPRSPELADAIEADNAEYQQPEGDEHHAKNFDNNSGHGSGAYADPDTVDRYVAWISSVVDEVNSKWLDKHTDPTTGEITPGVKGEVINTFQLSGHMLKWARAENLVNAPENYRSGQRDKFSALAWNRNPEAFEAEAMGYARSKWKEATAALAKVAVPAGQLPRDHDNDPDDEDDEQPRSREPGEDG